MQQTPFSPTQPYTDVLAAQEAAVASVIAGGPDQLFIGEHAPIYTTGSSAEAAHILNPGDIPVVATGRGGKVTYHGPGQLVAYPIFDLTTRRQDLRWYIQQLQQAIINTLAAHDITAATTDDVGVWVNGQKIAAIGVRVRKWVTFHGLALNVNCDLAPYQGIVPCGLTAGVTSMAEHGFIGNVQDVIPTLINELEKI